MFGCYGFGAPIILAAVLFVVVGSVYTRLVITWMDNAQVIYKTFFFFFFTKALNRDANEQDSDDLKHHEISNEKENGEQNKNKNKRKHKNIKTNNNNDNNNKKKKKSKSKWKAKEKQLQRQLGAIYKAKEAENTRQENIISTQVECPDRRSKKNETKHELSLAMQETVVSELDEAKELE
ncbi:hypothetical protein RFI_13786, partial [Reticulomyxa filosa]